MGNDAFSFDAEKHEYRLNGRVLPSVTQIIRRIHPGYQADPWYMDRGTQLHLACRYLDEGRLDWDTVDPEILGRVRAWQKFRKEFPWECVLIEKPMYHPTLLYAGTVDRVFFVPGGGCIVCDLKSSLLPQVKIQLGFYATLTRLYVQGGLKKCLSLAVQLNDDGTFRTLWRLNAELRRDEQVAMATLTDFNFQVENGIGK